MNNSAMSGRATQGRLRYIRYNVATPPPPPAFQPNFQAQDETFFQGNSAYFRMSPRTPEGLRTTGFAFGLFQADPNGAILPAGTPTAPGYTVDVWRYQPEVLNWTHVKQYTGLNYRDLIICADINGGLVYFQLGNAATDGHYLLSFQEQ